VEEPNAKVENTVKQPEQVATLISSIASWFLLYCSIASITTLSHLVHRVTRVCVCVCFVSKSREQKEAELIPKMQEAVNYGLRVLDSAFEQLDIKAGNLDSEDEEDEEDEEAADRVEAILEPKVLATTSRHRWPPPSDLDGNPGFVLPTVRR